MNDVGYCPRHAGRVLQYICTAETCANQRQSCEACKNKDQIHFSEHGQYIYKKQDFYDFLAVKELVPRLQKSLSDTEVKINQYKVYYKNEVREIVKDFDNMCDKFQQLAKQYCRMYCETYEKEMVVFDKEQAAIHDTLKKYAAETGNNVSFFSSFFSTSDSQIEPSNIEGLINKHAKAFNVRARLMNMLGRFKIAADKKQKQSYKQNENKMSKFEMHYKQFLVSTATFFDNLKEVLPLGALTNKKNKDLQSKSLEMSQVSLSRSSLSLDNMRKSMVIDRSFVAVQAMPKPHPLVLQQLQKLSPLQVPIQLTNRPNEGPFKYSNGVYFGGYENGLRSGCGTFVFTSDGTLYEGTWENDTMSGYGRLVKHNSYYQGSIFAACAHGHGYYEDSIRTYKGDWRNDKRSGQGIQVFKKNKVTYKGRFLQDKYDGSGQLIEEEYIYSGDYKNGLFHGVGMMRYKNGENYEGSFLDGKIVYGKHVFSDGSFYEGEFQDGVPHGNGDFIWADGIKYSGSWKEGNQDGVGIQQSSNSKPLKGVWQAGTWRRWINQ